jgi:3-hydroxyisobutyrate dehydrogenase-like beta-hydroxyacid dehydrogenase
MGEAKRHGIAVAGNLPAAVADREFVVSLLPLPQDVEAVATGPDGILSHIRHDALYIEMSTIDPVSVRRIGARFRERGIAMIDSPVTRSVDMAWKGRSALLIGGEDGDVARAMPVLGAVSDLQTYCGPLGNGSAMKLANNFMAHGILAVVCETLAIGLKSGLTLETIMLATERSGTFNQIDPAGGPADPRV